MRLSANTSAALAALLISIAGWPASAADPTESAQAGSHYYETHIRPLLVQHCYACHSQDADEAEAGLRLDSRAQWSRGGDSGPAIVPGDVEASLLVRAVRYVDDDLQMPPSGPLSAQGGRAAGAVGPVGGTGVRGRVGRPLPKPLPIQLLARTTGPFSHSSNRPLPRSRTVYGRAVRSIDLCSRSWNVLG